MVLLKYSIHQPMRLSTSNHFIHNTFSSVKSAAIKSDQCTDHHLHTNSSLMWERRLKWSNDSGCFKQCNAISLAKYANFLILQCFTCICTVSITHNTPNKFTQWDASTLKNGLDMFSWATQFPLLGTTFQIFCKQQAGVHVSIHY